MRHEPKLRSSGTWVGGHRRRNRRRRAQPPSHRPPQPLFGIRVAGSEGSPEQSGGLLERRVAA